jgi:hypothetical protein
MITRGIKSFLALMFIGLHSMSFAIPTLEMTKKPVILKSGSNVRIAVSGGSSQYLSVGQTIPATCGFAIKIDGEEVVSQGAEARVRVVQASNPKILGRPGQLMLEAISVTSVDGQEIPLRSSPITATGEDKSTISLVVGIFLCFPVLFMKGGEAILPPGSTLDAFVVSDVEVEID